MTRAPADSGPPGDRGRVHPLRGLVEHRARVLAVTALAALVAGGLAHLAGAGAGGR